MRGADPVTGRFAPSPSGRMHLGNVWSCLLAWLGARSAGGRVVLRLEDLDPDRCKQSFCDQVMRDLEWLGLDWDGAPVYQSRRAGLYDQAFSRLEERGLVYPCFCSRAQRLAASAPHRGDRSDICRCGGLSPEERDRLLRERRPAWRLRVPDRTFSFRDLIQGACEGNPARDCGDFILRRSDGVYAYQLAVVVDDAEMGVTQVVRGNDLLSSVPRQNCLQDLLGLPRPRYAHVPLLLAADGRRLAKRDRDQELSALQARFTAPELVGRLACLAGLLPAPEPVEPGRLLPLFSWEKLPREDIRVGVW